MDDEDQDDIQHQASAIVLVLKQLLGQSLATVRTAARAVLEEDFGRIAGPEELLILLDRHATALEQAAMALRSSAAYCKQKTAGPDDDDVE